MTDIGGGITFQQERAQEHFNEVKPLLERHFAEVAHYTDIPLDPDWALYETAENAGWLRAYSVRQDGELKGYGVFFVRNTVHYKGSLQATQDVLFLVPEMRNVMLGARFILWCDEQLRKEGVQVVYHHVKTNKLDFGPLLKRLGYESIDTIWGKRLDKE